MAKRRAGAGTSAATSGSNVYVSFDGLAELLRVSAGQSLAAPAPNVAPLNTTPLAMVAPTNPVEDRSKWPKMTLPVFCDQFEVPNSIQGKLLQLGVQGPHVLYWLKDEDLLQEGGLLLGELGTLRDAEQRWKNFCSWDL